MANVIAGPSVGATVIAGPPTGAPPLTSDPEFQKLKSWAEQRREGPVNSESSEASSDEPSVPMWAYVVIIVIIILIIIGLTWWYWNRPVAVAAVAVVAAVVEGAAPPVVVQTMVPLPEGSTTVPQTQGLFGPNPAFTVLPQAAPIPQTPIPVVMGPPRSALSV